MTTSRRLIAPVLAAAAAFGLAIAAGGVALADPAGDKALAAVDAAVNKAKTHQFVYDITNQEPGKGEKKLGMIVKMKGDKRLSEFTAPGDMKGTKVLILSPTEMYVYLPAFGKVRRIASHVNDQSAFGMAFSQDDLATQTLSPIYSAQLASETPAEVKLVLTPKPGQPTTYSKVEVTVTKGKNLPAELKYYSAQGTHVKTETRTGYTCEGDICTPGQLKMVDHSKGGLTTTVVRKSWKLNEELGDDVFSKRSLEK